MSVKYPGVINYTGSKTKLMPNLLDKFKEAGSTSTFIDACAGGLSVSLAVASTTDMRVISNDFCRPLHDMYAEMSAMDFSECMASIRDVMSDNAMSKFNKEGYLSLVGDYNSIKDPVMLLVLLYHSFSNQIRFNGSGLYNMPFGKRSFNPESEKKLNRFYKILESKEISFHCMDVFELIRTVNDDTLLYIDPPYLITDATYNSMWSDTLDVKLMEELDKLTCKWVMSNVYHHKGKSNQALIDWSAKHEVQILSDVTYVSGAYQAKNTDKPTVEVLISNF